MWEFFKDVWRNLRIISNYTSSQKEALAKLQQICMHRLKLKELKGTLLESTQEGFPTENSADLANQLMRTISPERMNVDSPLSVYANSLLLDIAHYLFKRNERYLNSGYPNDPINLFCLQLVDWLKSRLVTGECKHDVLEEVNNWVYYLDDIVTGNVFSYDEQPDVRETVNIVITNVKQVFEEVRDYIKLELSRNTIEKELESLVNRGKNYISFCFDYLFYSLNDMNEPPRNFTIININMADQSKLMPEIKQIIEKTRLGEYLAYLATTESINELFFPGRYALHKPFNKPVGFNEKQEKGSGFLSVEGNAGVELIHYLLMPITNTLPKPSGIVLFRPKQQEKNRTITEINNDQLAAANSLVLLCGYLNVFAQVVLYCREAAYLSGKTGDLLLCKLSHSQLEFLINSFRQLYKAIFKQISTLKKLTEDINHAWLGENIKNTPWQKNLAEANRIYQVIEPMHDTAFEMHLEPIIRSMKTVDKQIEETKKRLYAFVQDVNIMMRALPWLVPGKQNPQSTLSFLPEKTEKMGGDSKPSLVGDSHILQGEIENQTLYFIEEDVPADGECGFYALDVEREAVINELIQKTKEDVYLRQLIAPEIKNTFVGVLDYMPNQLRETVDYKELQRFFQKAYGDLDALTKQIIAEFSPDQSIKAKGNEQVLLWAAAQPMCVKKYGKQIANCKDQLKKVEGQLNAYCQHPVVIGKFLRIYYLENKEWLVYLPEQTTTLDAIAQLKGYNVHVWQLGEHKRLLHNHAYYCTRSSNEQVPVKHLLHTGIHKGLSHYNHFKRLLDKRMLSLHDQAHNEKHKDSAVSTRFLMSANSFFNLDTETMLAQAKALQAERKHHDALRCLNELLTRSPRNPDWLFLRGKSLAATGQRELAVNDFTLALKYTPNKVKVWLERGITLERLGRKEEALKDYNAVLASDENDVGVLTKRAKLLIEGGDLQAGFNDFERALRIAPMDTRTLLSRSEQYLLLAKYEEAMADLNRILILQPEDKLAQARLAEVKRLRDKFTVAKQASQRL